MNVLELFAKAFAGARGNDRFVKTRPLSTLTSAWAAALALSPTSVPSPSLDPLSGMVPWLSWAALLAERDLGKSVFPSPSPPSSENDARARLWKRETAAKLLANAPPLSLLDVEIAVRRVEPTRSLLTLVLDRASAEGLFVRVTVDAWLDVTAKDGVLVHNDRATASRALQDVLSLASQLPAPALLVRASTLPGIVVERLSRGVIGPAIHAERAAGFDVAAGAFALVVSSEELAGDIAVTVDNDVFADPAESGGAGCDLGAVVDALPKPLARFKCFRDAKVVATSTLAAQVKQRAQQRKKKTVVHELR